MYVMRRGGIIARGKVWSSRRSSTAEAHADLFRTGMYVRRTAACSFRTFTECRLVASSAASLSIASSLLLPLLLLPLLLLLHKIAQHTPGRASSSRSDARTFP